MPADRNGANDRLRAGVMAGICLCASLVPLAGHQPVALAAFPLIALPSADRIARVPRPSRPEAPSTHAVQTLSTPSEPQSGATAPPPVTMAGMTEPPALIDDLSGGGPHLALPSPIPAAAPSDAMPMISLDGADPLTRKKTDPHPPGPAPGLATGPALPSTAAAAPLPAAAPPVLPPPSADPDLRQHLSQPSATPPSAPPLNALVPVAVAAPSIPSTLPSRKPAPPLPVERQAARRDTPPRFDTVPTDSPRFGEAHQPSPRHSTGKGGAGPAGSARTSMTTSRTSTVYTVAFGEGSAALTLLGTAIVEQAGSAATTGAVVLRAGLRPIDRNRAIAVRDELLSYGVQSAIADGDDRVPSGEVRIEVR